jgi:Arabinose efflux permease
MTETASQHITDYLDNTFHSLKNRNFRYFWIGQCVSLIGTFMQRTAQYWLVYTITKSPFALGMLGVCQFLPMLVLSLPVGVLIDRFPKRRLLIATQVLFLLQAVSLTVLTWLNITQYWHILALSTVYGVTQTIEMPTRQTFLFELVGKDDIMNAVSLNSTIVNTAKIFGPALAGIVMQRLGITMCFGLNAASYIAVMAGLFLIRVPRGTIKRAQTRITQEAAGGLRFIRSRATLVVCILIFSIVGTFAMNQDVIAPVFAEDILGRGANGYTGLLTAAGIGSLLAALLMASRSRYGAQGRILILGGAGSVLLHIATIFTTDYYVSLALIAGIGFFTIVFLNTANAMFQMGTPDEYRSRVMSVYSLILFGSTPIGNFFAGTIMEHIPGNSGFVGCGAAALLLLIPVFIVNRAFIAGWFKKPGREIEHV